MTQEQPFPASVAEGANGGRRQHRGPNGEMQPVGVPAAGYAEM